MLLTVNKVTERVYEITVLKQTEGALSERALPALLAGVHANNVGPLYHERQGNVGFCNKTEKRNGNS